GGGGLAELLAVRRLGGGVGALRGSCGCGGGSPGPIDSLPLGALPRGVASTPTVRDAFPGARSYPTPVVPSTMPPPGSTPITGTTETFGPGSGDTVTGGSIDARGEATYGPMSPIFNITAQPGSVVNINTGSGTIMSSVTENYGSIPGTNPGGGRPTVNP